MLTNQSINLKKSLRCILSILITLNFFSCSLENITDTDNTNITENEGETSIEEPDTSIDIPTTEPITEEPTEEIVTEEPVVENPVIVIEEPTEEVIEENLTEAESLLILVNESRAAEGLSPLKLNDALTKAALSHSADMDANDYFDHTGLNGSRFWDRTEDAGYTGSPAGENIALGQRDAEAVHAAWMSSEGHRNNILNSRITEMGLGHSGRYWTQIFGIAN